MALDPEQRRLIQMINFLYEELVGCFKPIDWDEWRRIYRIVKDESWW